MDKGKPPPDRAFAPELFSDLQPAWHAFLTLSDDRPLYIGMGGGTVGRIPYRTIQEYAERVSDDPEELIRWVRFLDGEYVKQTNEKRASQRPKTEPARPARDPRLINKVRK